MKNLFNNNNNSNSNNKLNILNGIKNGQKQLDDLTNNLEKLESEQIKSVNKYYRLLIDDRERFEKQHKKLYTSYYKKALEDKENSKEYKKLKQETINDISNAKVQIYNFKRKLLTPPIVVPSELTDTGKKKYQVDNGILGAKRDINNVEIEE
jgi:hypothetical protein